MTKILGGDSQKTKSTKQNKTKVASRMSQKQTFFLLFFWGCDKNYQKLGFISKHKESLDNLMLTLKSHHSGDVHRAVHDL